MCALSAAGAACVHYLAGKKSINISGKCHSGPAWLEISKIYACCRGSMRRKTSSLMVLPVYHIEFEHRVYNIFSKLLKMRSTWFARSTVQSRFSDNFAEDHFFIT